MYENEELRACKKVDSKVEKFTNTIYGELMNFNLDEQNGILKVLHQRTTDGRKNNLSELLERAQILELSLKELN